MQQAAETLFADNVNYNSQLMKRRAAKRTKVGEHKVGPEEAVQRLSELGIEITGRTLQNWAYRYKVITKPKTGSYGKGRGRWAHYSEVAIKEAVTVHILREKYRLNISEIAAARANPETDHGVLWGFHFSLFSESGDLKNSMDPSPDFIKQYSDHPAVKRYYKRTMEKLQEMFPGAIMGTYSKKGSMHQDGELILHKIK